MTTRTSCARIKVNRAPVLRLWAAVVAERLGFSRDEALTMGRAVAGLNAYAKGKSLGLFKPAPQEVRRERSRLRHGAQMQVDLLNRAVPVERTPDGLRAVSKGKPVAADSVQRYLTSRFGDQLDTVGQAMNALARALPVDELAASAYRLYEAFRPEVPAGLRGWGAAGVLDMERIRKAAQSFDQRAAAGAAVDALRRPRGCGRASRRTARSARAR